MGAGRPQLQEIVSEASEALQVPGVAVGVFLDGDEHYAFHGVTSVENPLDVDERTLFLAGSTCKTFTATTMMRLADQGLLDLHTPVRTYVPDLRLRDNEVERQVTVFHARR